MNEASATDSQFEALVNNVARLIKTIRLLNTQSELQKLIKQKESYDIIQYVALRDKIDSYSIQLRNFVDISQQLKQQMMESRSSTLQILRHFTMAFIHGYKKAYEKMEWLTEADILELSNQAISEYLQWWLESDSSMKRTISHFARCRFGKAPVDGTNHEDAEKAALVRAYNEYIICNNLRITQAQERNETPPETPERVAQKIPLNPLILRWCDAWAKGYLTIIKQLLFSKHLINRKSYHDKVQNQTIYRALTNYQSFLYELERLSNVSASSREQNIEYVTGCMVVQEIELAYRYQLASHMAQYCADHECSLSCFVNHIMEAYFGAFEVVNSPLLDLFDASTDGRWTFSRYSHVIMNYKQIFDFFLLDQTINLEQKALEQISRRAILQDMCLVLNALYPPKDRAAWTNQDFREAAEFYRNEYPFISEYLKFQYIDPETALNKADKVHIFYNEFHAIYRQQLNIQESQLKRAIDYHNTCVGVREAQRNRPRKKKDKA